MAFAVPPATCTALPPFLGMDQICSTPLTIRSQSNWVELRAITLPFVASFGASTITSDWNSAVTLVSACSVSVQVSEFPLHAPPHPIKRVAPAALAVSVTVLPLATITSQVVTDSPQLRPPPVTVPDPVTDAVRCTCAGGGGGWATKLAKTVASFESVRVHADGPLQSLPQPEKLKPAAGAAVSVIDVPESKTALQVEESQSSPAG